MSFIQKINKKFLELGPAIFIIGYVVGTGSVTSMVKSGADYGLSLWWALFLSCVFTYFLIVSISKLTIVSGTSLLESFIKNFGIVPSLFIAIAVFISIVSSCVGIMGIAADVVAEWLGSMLSLDITAYKWLIALVFIFFLLTLFWTGKHEVFIKGMTIMVAIMAVSFLITSIAVLINPDVSWEAFKATNTNKEGFSLVIAGMVGTTMASVVLVSRSFLVQEEGWQLKDLAKENKDARISMIMAFLVSFAIMICAAGTLYVQKVELKNPIDMMKALEPFAGDFAMTIFALGTVSAGLSSIFPNLLLAGWVMADFSKGPRDLDKPLYKVVVVAVAFSMLLVPILGGKPIIINIASQALSPFVMPLLTLFLMILLNKKSIMGEHKIGTPLNIALGVTFIFNVYTMITAIIGFAQELPNMLSN